MRPTKKKFSFGKIAYRNPNVRNNEVTVDIEWKPNSKGKMVFSASGDVWNNIHTDIYCGGQCLDTLNDFPEIRANPTFQKIYRLWKLYHLNDMHAGTVEQEKALKEHFGAHADYYDACNYLQSINLLVVPNPYTGKPYKYGSGWLYREIPEEDVKIIEELLGGEE